MCLGRDLTPVDLDLPDAMLAWLRGVPRPPGAPGPALPGDAEADRLLERLGVAAADRADTLAARPDPVAHPGLWWVLDRAYHDMLAHLGVPQPVDGFPGWPAVPADTGAVGRHLYVWLYLAMLPLVRRYHAHHGIPDAVSWTSLAELGREMAEAKAMYGVSGLNRQWASPLRFRGVFYRLGRLAFDRATAPFTDQPLRRGEAAVNTHIPEDGRLDPDACDEAFARARAFFTTHFPERPIAFVCSSWLLDEQLAEYLPETSNLIRFQRRFRPLPPPGGTSDTAILEFVFHHPVDGPEIPETLLDRLPQDTTLRRAYVTHLRAGRHWHARTGWFPL